MRQPLRAPEADRISSAKVLRTKQAHVQGIVK